LEVYLQPTGWYTAQNYDGGSAEFLKKKPVTELTGDTGRDQPPGHKKKEVHQHFLLDFSIATMLRKE
jgi:hypothetical protein